MQKASATCTFQEGMANFKYTHMHDMMRFGRGYHRTLYFRLQKRLSIRRIPLSSIRMRYASLLSFTISYRLSKYSASRQWRVFQ